MMIKWIKERLSLWMVLGAAGTTFVLCILCGLLNYFILPGGSISGGQEGAVITLIPYPTATPTAVSIPDAIQQTPIIGSEGLQIGKIVRIANSVNDGLNLRFAPGVNNPSRFLALGGEKYLIMDGPVNADGYTWWNLAAPGDPSLNGWAVGDFLEVITSPR
jgi:hypothetical protein